jgi:hypothetical protein
MKLIKDVQNMPQYVHKRVQSIRLVHYTENYFQYFTLKRLLFTCSPYSWEEQACITRLFTARIVLYGCKTWSLTLREEHKLRVSENRVLRRVFWPRRDEVTGRSWMISIPYPILCGWLNREEWDGWGMRRVWGRREGCTGCW